MKWTISIPLKPPSLNLWVHLHWRTRKDIMDEWAKAIWALCNEQHIPRMERIKLDATVYFKDNRRRDYDNYGTVFKLTLDSLKRIGIIPDDNTAHVERPILPELEVDHDNPRTEVTITNI